MIKANADIQAVPRKFLPKDFTVTSWDALEPYFQQLLDQAIAIESRSGTMAKRFQRNRSCAE